VAKAKLKCLVIGTIYQLFSGGRFLEMKITDSKGIISPE